MGVRNRRPRGRGRSSFSADLSSSNRAYELLSSPRSSSGGVRLRFNLYTLPLTVLLFCYLAGGWLSFTQLDTFGKPFITWRRRPSSRVLCVFAAAIVRESGEAHAAHPQRYVNSAVIAAAIGVLAYFEVLPHSDLFKRYDRAMGPFQDPNVFGTFPGAAALLSGP